MSLTISFHSALKFFFFSQEKSSKLIIINREIPDPEKRFSRKIPSSLVTEKIPREEEERKTDGFCVPEPLSSPPFFPCSYYFYLFLLTTVFVSPLCVCREENCESVDDGDQQAT